MTRRSRRIPARDLTRGLRSLAAILGRTLAGCGRSGLLELLGDKTRNRRLMELAALYLRRVSVTPPALLRERPPRDERERVSRRVRVQRITHTRVDGSLPRHPVLSTSPPCHSERRPPESKNPGARSSARSAWSLSNSRSDPHPTLLPSPAWLGDHAVRDTHSAGRKSVGDRRYIQKSSSRAVVGISAAEVHTRGCARMLGDTMGLNIICEGSTPLGVP